MRKGKRDRETEREREREREKGGDEKGKKDILQSWYV